MTRNRKVLIGASVFVLGAISALTLGAAAHDRGKTGHEASYRSHHGDHGMRHGWKKRMRAERMFERFDTDRDGTVTLAEIDKSRADRLAKFDANTDGVLQLEEYQGLWLERMRERMVKSFQRLDRDGDGKVTGDELKTPAARIARYLDKDGDGVITREELHHRRGGKRDR